MAVRLERTDSIDQAAAVVVGSGEYLLMFFMRPTGQLGRSFVAEWLLHQEEGIPVDDRLFICK
jgi:hypothetical protein